MKKNKREPKKLTPPDEKRCQSERPNGHSFMTLGGRPGLERCEAEPVVIVTELLPGEDGLIGSMSLCGHCLNVFIDQVGYSSVRISGIDKEKKGS